MRRIITAALAALAFAGIGMASSAKAQVLDRPEYVGNVDLFKLEDATKTQWEKSFPRIVLNLTDYDLAWERLMDRSRAISSKWYQKYSTATLYSKEERDLKDMWYWCDAFKNAMQPTVVDVADEKKKSQAAMLFAQLEVRLHVCEDVYAAKTTTSPKQK